MSTEVLVQPVEFGATAKTTGRYTGNPNRYSTGDKIDCFGVAANDAVVGVVVLVVAGGGGVLAVLI